MNINEIAVLQQAIIDDIQSQVGKAVKVKGYAGEFNALESNRESYNCPAIFVTILGFEPSAKSRYASNGVTAHVAVYCVEKEVNRLDRFIGASSLAVYVCKALQHFKRVTDPCVSGISDIRAQNLYSEAIDRKGQSLWVVTGKADLELIEQLPDYMPLESVEIESHARTCDPTQPKVLNGLTVEHTLDKGHRDE